MIRFIHMITLAAMFVLTTVACDADSKPERILCYGDSITAGGKWVAIVGAHKSIVTVNAGKSGRRAAHAREELAPYLEKFSNLDKIILFLGVNDLPARDKRPDDVKVAGCVTNMSEAVDLAMMRFRPENIILVAPCNVNPDTISTINREKGYHVTPPLLAKLEKEYKALAKKKGIQFVSLLNVVSRENYKDGIHPNAAGDAEIAEAILDFLATQ